MSVFQGMNISASGLTAERLRMDVIAGNISNQNTTQTETGEAYRRKVTVFAEAYDSAKNEVSGVLATEIKADMSELEQVYDPSHPHANEEGYYTLPNVDPLNEMIDMMVASRSYSANITALNASKSMYVKALEIGR